VKHHMVLFSLNGFVNMFIVQYNTKCIVASNQKEEKADSIKKTVQKNRVLSFYA